MLQLNTYSPNVCDEYAARILPGLIKRIKNGRTNNGLLYSLNEKAKNLLLPEWNTDHHDESKLKSLLIAEPREHFKLNEDLGAGLNQLGVDDKTLELIFNYEGVFNSKAGRDTAYWLAEITGRHTCTYCNRQYIFTIDKVENDGAVKKLARPVFDHWFPKSKYPLLSLNMYNLIPSCTICNSSIKGDAEMKLDTHIHPYISEPEASAFTFRATKKASQQSEWILKIDRQPGSKIDKTIEDMALEPLYSSHSTLEVKDIMDFNDAYPDEYINTLIDDLLKSNNNGLSRTDIYRILFGVEALPEKFLDRPFSKLKSDLLKQIGLKL